MAEVITSDQLRVGDVFFDPRRVGVDHASDWHPGHGLRRVLNVQTMNVGAGSYVVVKYANLLNVGMGHLDLRVDVAMARVEPIENPSAIRRLTELADGERVTFWRAEGRVWV